ncbi:MAG: dihydrofolate reductase family protein [Anaerolineae bacterium]
MRRIFLFMNISLDGCVADANGDISGFHNDFEAFSPGASGEVDTLLFGHKTYEMMQFWSTPQAVELQPDIARFMNERQKVVVSHQPFEPGWSKVSVISGDAMAGVRQLKAGAGKDIIILGSNNLCVSLMQHRLIDEFQLMVNPVVFGGGMPLFAGLPEKAALTLKDTRPFKSGAVLLTYAPAA